MKILALLCAVVVSVSYSQKKRDELQRTANIERGKYLVENVANCIHCHSPRESNGELIRTKLLEGASVPVGKPNWAYVWAEFAPRIAGLPQYSGEQALRLLTTGIGKDGKPLRAPMPVFKMLPNDAQDVVGYLKSMR